MKKELQRLRQFRKSLNLSQENFGKPLGSNQSSISDVERGKVGISSDLLRGLILIYRLNPFWLFFGKPPMQISEADLEALSVDEEGGNPEDYSLDDDGGMIPLTSSNLVIPVDLHADYVKAVKTGKWDAERMARASYAKLPGVSGTMRTFQINGDSMMPSFVNGDYVCCKSLIGLGAARDNGIYLLVTEEHGLTLARLTFNEKEKSILLNFENTESGGGLVVSYDKVMEIWDVQVRLTAVFNMPFERRLKNLEEKVKLLPPPS